MNHQFDELTKSLAQSVTRRAALKKLGVGLAGMALTWFGIAPKAQAGDACNTCVKACVEAGYSKHDCHHYVCSLFCGGKPPKWA